MWVPIAMLSVAFPFTGGGWQRDFAMQPVGKRPALEVRYTDGSRTAFAIEAEAYRLTGELGKPHRLLDAATGEEWLSLGVEDETGAAHVSKHAEPPSRINLYRRGPYFCEVHWLDVQVADDQGHLAPLKGDLALYCYPDKILASITWHALDDFAATAVRADGVVQQSFKAEPFKKGDKQTFAFPVFGETEPLPDSAFDSFDAVPPTRYDRVRGCYTIGSTSPGGFQGHFFDHPNRYETVRFTMKNDGPARTVYICHETIGGGRGSVEGGVLLDDEGHPLPIVVQISKNFAGEKEEPFYNPEDTPFSETYFPLLLGKNERRTLTSLHLYQNWGRHMVKQFSSLGAWMDYFHSSTGVTETTCYVPFKFTLAGTPGIHIADLRAMSQASFWDGQPQHDNVAGHIFLTYKAGDTWEDLVYQKTTYRSTGPNWMDIGLEYRSTDGKIKANIDTFESPQVDELRNFIRVRYKVLQPLTIHNATENFRVLTVGSWVQGLRYTRFAASGHADRALDFSGDHLDIRGAALPSENGFAALYGESKGSNAVVIRTWRATTKGKPIGPAASVWCQKSGDTRLLIVPDADDLTLEPGDSIEFEAFWLPYGEVQSAETPRREATAYGSEAPRITTVAKGEQVADFPTTVQATRNNAQFTLEGGRDLVPVIVTGLTESRWPRIYRRDEQCWRVLSHARVGDLDGIQVFCEGKRRFGAVFLVHSDSTPQELRVTAGKRPETPPRITVRPAKSPPGDWHHIALIQAPWMDAPIRLRFPETLHTDGLDFIDHQRDDMQPRVNPGLLANVWQESEGGSIFFKWGFENQTTGGRLSPNEDDVDLEFWLGNRRDKPVHIGTQFCPILAGTLFEDGTLERSWVFTRGRWKRMADTDRGDGKWELCHYGVAGGPPVSVPLPWGASSDAADLGVAAVTSADGRYLFAVAWPTVNTILSNADIPCVHTDPVWPECPPGRRVHMRGKVYLMEGTLDDLLHRVRREVVPQGRR